MSIKVRDFLQMDKLQGYFDEIQRQQEKREKISQLTKFLLDKSQQKLKLQNRKERVDNRFNQKLREMKQLNTFMDVKKEIIGLNVMNNRYLMDQLEDQLHSIDLQKIDPQHLKDYSIFHYNKGKLQQIPCSIDPKYFDIASNQPKEQDQTSTTYLFSSPQKRRKYVQTIIDDTFVTQSAQQNMTELKIAKSQHTNASNIDSLYENGLLLNQSNQARLTVSRYYGKYQQQTNNLIRKMKLKCQSKYNETIQLQQQSEKQSKVIFEDKVFLQQNKTLIHNRSKSQQLSKQKYQDKCSTSDTQKSPPKDNLKRYSDERNKTIGTMIHDYQCQVFREKRFKTPQYRRTIGQKFLQFNKSLTEIETEISRSSKENIGIIKKMDTIVSEVYDKYKVQTNFFEFD